MSQSNYGQYPFYGYQQQRYTDGTQMPQNFQGQPQFQPVQTGGTVPGTSSGGMFPGAGTGGGMGAPSAAPSIPGMLPLEQSYIENILRLNRGKLATVYATFENNTEWNAKIFKGIIEAAGRDHLILSDPQTGQRILLPMIYLDYVTFDEEIEYEYPFGGGQGMSQYSPR
ncbi:spore coat protein GerQ [Cytobacillus oceanisediminis]|uniref:spore coat protein GerQ n=1 Tax=Cytobacillus oceanisediminis TaxID=665099 RepID=UPI0018654FA3|nr:spore coat protein GerQ [Cytobacillus oceanisediminis]QOK26090.1 spore coat protein GerQ [Cytobacillus oceanisediminis]